MMARQAHHGDAPVMEQGRIMSATCWHRAHGNCAGFWLLGRAPGLGPARKRSQLPQQEWPCTGARCHKLRPTHHAQACSPGACLMVVAPHQGGAADEVIRQPHQLVHPGLGRHGPMVAAVLHREANPCACQTCTQGPSTSLLVRGQPPACCPGPAAAAAGMHWNAPDTPLYSCLCQHIYAVCQHAAMQSVRLYPPRKKPVTALVS